MLVIKNWNTHFEKAQSRNVSNLTWVAIPNNLNSRGYRKIMKQIIGAENQSKELDTKLILWIKNNLKKLN